MKVSTLAECLESIRKLEFEEWNDIKTYMKK